MEELLGWSLDGALDPWSCFQFFYEVVKQKPSKMTFQKKTNKRPSIYPNLNKTKGLKLHRETIPTALS